MPTKAPAHRPAHATNDDARPSAAKRGYGRRWQKYRLAFLARHPLCAICERGATDVDHVTPVTGPFDPVFWEPTNHQSLCGDCHKRKTALEDGGFGRPAAAGGRGAKIAGTSRP